MRNARFTAIVAASLLIPTAFAAESSGLQILLDMQDPTVISKSFCVLENKLYSEDAQVCVTSSLRLICATVDAADKTKGLKWTMAPDEKTPRCK